MKKELNIIITGHANVGKSTVLVHIEKLLRENGYDVELSLKDHPDYTGENAYHFRNSIMLHFDEKIEAIKSNVKIILKETQLNRDSIKKEY